MIPDVQSRSDTRKIKLDKVGVRGVRYPIVVEDRSAGLQHTIASADIYVGLPQTSRGAHMSRFIEVLNRFHESAIIGRLPEFLKALRTAMKSTTVYATMRFPYFVRKTAPVSKKTSLLAYDCLFEASLDDARTPAFDLKIGVTVPIQTLCPCSKEMSRFGAHNQRSYVKVEVAYDGFVWLEELIDAVESVASSEVYPLLKRADEKHVTEQAYCNPKFAEDIVRDLALILKADPRIRAFRVETENLESIHDHNAYAMVDWLRE
jgi:GTP cyclohydrolase IB